MSRLKYSGGILLLILAVIISVGCARNRPVRNSKGAVVPNSVSYAEQVNLNGMKQWIYVRGTNANAPVILWLDGAPGGSEIGLVRTYLEPLHRNFVVVGWDQRGTGRNSLDQMKNATVDDYVRDTIALSELLDSRFNQKILVVGRGWGSVIGLKALAQRPDLFQAFVGVAQRVNAGETDKLTYEMVCDGSRRFGDSITFTQLVRNGPPPYSGKQSADYDILFRSVPHYAPRCYGMKVIDPSKAYTTEHDMGDRGSLGQRLQYGYTYLYPQLNGLDFEKQVTEVKVPCFFVVGRYDFVTPGSITDRYYQKLQAPTKDLVWFELSNNYACFQEPEKFTDYMVNTVVPRSKAAAVTTEPAPQ